MIVVPLSGDKITGTFGTGELKVVEYTRFKSGGPAVYCTERDSKNLILVYFFDIKTINNVDVEYIKSSHVFKALGKIKRKFNLPQKGFRLYITRNPQIDNSDDDALEKQSVIVDKVMIKLGKTGLIYGLYAQDKDKNLINVKQILDIDSDIGSEPFNRADYIKYYKDYIGN